MADKELEALNREVLLSKRNVKDSVFTSLFRDKRYVFELYQALFPDDREATPESIQLLTLEYNLVNADYNDLGFLVGNRLIVLVEAQSEWSDNIIIRVFLYLAQTWKNYIDEHDELNVHSTKLVHLPRPEFFVIYTGPKDVGEVVSYRETFLAGEESVLDVKVKVLRDGKQGDIINQYVTFTQIVAEQVRLHGRTREAIAEVIRICKDRNVLREYMTAREKEVVTIMIELYDYENNLKKRLRFERWEGKEEGKEEGMAEGQAKTSRLAARNLYSMGMSLEKIAQALECPVMDVKKWVAV